MEDDGVDYGDGDASHRLLDRRTNAAKDREAEELAASFRNRYGKARYDTEGVEEWAPKALLMPGVNDASIWGLKCKVSKECPFWVQGLDTDDVIYRLRLDASENSFCLSLERLRLWPPPTMLPLFRSSPPSSVTPSRVTFMSKHDPNHTFELPSTD